jgi:hypothetical protein
MVPMAARFEDEARESTGMGFLVLKALAVSKRNREYSFVLLFKFP